MPDHPGRWVACFNERCDAYMQEQQVTEQRDTTKARARHSKEATSIAARAAVMTLADVPPMEHGLSGLPGAELNAYRAAVLAGFQRLTAYMSEHGTTRWAESERKWAHVLNVPRATAMRHLVRMQAFGWVELDKKPVTVERHGATRYVRPTVKRSGNEYATTSGGQTRVTLRLGRATR